MKHNPPDGCNNINCINNCCENLFRIPAEAEPIIFQKLMKESSIDINIDTKKEARIAGALGENNDNWERRFKNYKNYCRNVVYMILALPGNLNFFLSVSYELYFISILYTFISIKRIKK
ncbi:MAG: hypothetical protein LWY06_07450 [Firmicutes bacterium]|nr:hypothetical protein [Bacillota bacterium]